MNSAAKAEYKVIHDKECHSKMWMEGTKWGVILGGTAVIAHLVMEKTWPAWKNKVPVSFKYMVITGAAISGFMVSYDHTGIQCRRSYPQGFRKWQEEKQNEAKVPTHD